MARRHSGQELPERHLPCLTEMSTGALIAGALALSGLLWLVILAVL